MEIAKQNLEKAEYIYQNNRWKKAGKELVLNIIVNKDNQTQKRLAENLKNILELNGIRVNLNYMQSKTYYEKIENKEYEIALMGIRSSYTPNLERYFRNYGLLLQTNTETENILEECKNLQITNEYQNVLREKYFEIEKIYLETLPFIGLSRDVKKIIFSKSLVTSNQMNIYNIFQGFDKWYRK